MCGSFDRYLEVFRRFVVFGNDTSIVELSLRMAPLIKQIRALAKVLGIHPDGKLKCVRHPVSNQIK